MNKQSIAVFDSGVGGLTVLKALQTTLPDESFIYLGDTARLPYGTKSREAVIAYAQQAVTLLQQFDIKLLVIACNTASALALEPLQDAFPDLPIIGVLQPGAEAACAASKSGVIGLLATESTIHSHGYRNAIQALKPEATVVEQPCSLFVAIAEEGWAQNSVAEEAAKLYLNEIKHHPNLDCVVLGCTHFPVLQQVIQQVLGPNIVIVDSASTTAARVQTVLQERDLAAPKQSERRTTYLATDLPERFQRMASIFLGETIVAEHVSFNLR